MAFQSGSPSCPVCSLEVGECPIFPGFYQEVLSALPADLTVLDRNGHFFYINPAAVRDPATREWLIGRAEEDYCVACGIDPKFAQNRRKHFEQCLREGNTVSFEEECPIPNGRKHWFLRFYSPVMGPEEEIAQVIGYGIEITERKAIEQALRASEERYRLLFEGSRDAIAVYGRATQPLLFNARFLEMLGYTAEELLTTKLIDRVHPDDRDTLLRNNRDRLAGLPVPRAYEYRALKKSGEVLNIEATFDPIRQDGEVIGIQGVFRDITERKHAEEALRESEEKYRLLFDRSNESIAVFGTGLRPILANDRFLEMVGYTREELIGTNIRSLLHPDDFARVLDNNRRRMEGEPISRLYEFRAVRKDGVVIEVEGSFDLIRRGEEVIGIQGIFRDITERKRIQDSLFEQQKEQTIITLAGGIAHDFNNILLGVMGNAALLEDELAGLSSAKSLVKNILTSSARMAELTNQLLSYARGGKHRPEPSNLNDIIEDTLKILHGSLPSSVRIEKELDPGLWPVEADRTQMSQVLLNLLVNALEAMETGGVLTLRSENTRHASQWFGPGSELMPAGDYVHVVVSDTGVGMTEETRRRLFEPFYTTKFMGRGLGLAASQGIIYNHKGLIEVESQRCKGSTFHVTLPRTDRVPASQTAPTPAAKPYSGTILVVDDEETVRDVAERMLKRLGFQVLVAADGAAGLALHEQHRSEITLVLLDIQMEGMSGDEVFERLIESDPDVRVILSSGYEESTVASTFKCAERIAGFIQKPYTMAILIRTIDEVLAI